MGTPTSPSRPTRLDRWLPGWSVLRHYDRRWLWPDVIGGVTGGAMLVPQSMGYAELAGMPPQYGFYAVMTRGEGADESVARAVVDVIGARSGEAIADASDVSSWDGSKAMIDKRSTSSEASTPS
jgi:MFS superfamily sulfate permease-like transporter